MILDKTVLCLLAFCALVACVNVAYEFYTPDYSWRIIRRRAIEQGAWFIMLSAALLFLGHCTH
jgi:hypothetical protein